MPLWALQHMQFSLWRYGMLPTDSFEFWLGRRLEGFRDENDCYFGVNPGKGWRDNARTQFNGTDFQLFIDAAERIATSCRADDPLRRLRLQRLMLLSVGGDSFLRGTWFERWIRPKRFNLRRKADHLVSHAGSTAHCRACALAEATLRPTIRERRWVRVSCNLLATVLWGSIALTYWT